MAASDFLKKPHNQVTDPTSTIQQNPSKSCSNFFCKSLIIILVLVVIPLFPSQAPEFISKSILTELWELLHLLFIGLAVSYGLFSRKCVKMEIENQSRNDSSHAYLSGILNVPSFFDDGFENLCISDEKKIMQDWNSQYSYCESKFKEKSVDDEGKMLRSFTHRNGSDYTKEADREKMSQVWSYQYFQGESLVVVTDGNYSLDEHRPLGLPIRSLRSRIADSERPELTSRNESPSRLKGSFDSNNKGKNERIRGMIPSNLEKKFEEVVEPSAIPWKSRSGRMEIREKTRTPEPHCHHRPHSVGEFQFQHFQSRSFQQPVPNGTSSKSSASRMNTTLSSFAPEVPKLKTEHLNIMKDLKGSYDSISQSTLAERKGEISFAMTKERGSSIGSSSDLNVQRSSIEDFKDCNEIAVQDLLCGGKQISNSMSSDAKRSNLSKIPSRGKSVRTVRTGYLPDKMKRKEKHPNPIDDQVDLMSDWFEAHKLLNKEKGEEPKILPIHNRKQNCGKVYPMPQSAYSEYQNGEKLDLLNSVLVSEEDSESDSESDNFQESLDEKEAVSDHNDDVELEGSEVDRKADEFIAKFREQIRLQKIASYKR